MPAIQPITDELLINAIRRASERVVLISPGVWPPVAEAVAAAWEKLGCDRVTVILDVDPEICRIGYGSLEGIQILQNAAAKQGEALGQEPGIRICVFIVDQETFVFSPTPRQLEAPPGESPGSASLLRTQRSWRSPEIKTPFWITRKSSASDGGPNSSR